MVLSDSRSCDDMGTTQQTASYSYYPTHARIFGDDLAAPRHLYFSSIPAFLALAGMLSWVFSGDPGLVLGSVAATAVSVYTLWDWLFRHAPTRLSTLLAMALLLGYGGGALNTWLTLPRGTLSLSEIMGLGEGVLNRGIAAVLFSSALLYFFGEIFEKPIFGQSFRLQIDRTTRSLVFLGALAMLGGYATHSLAIEGAASSEGHVSILGMFLTWLYTPITALAVASFVTARLRREKLLAGFSSLVLILMFAVLGRRATLYTTIEILFVLALVGYRWRGKGIRNLLLIISMGAVVALCSLTFMLLRIAPLGHRIYGKMSVSQRFEAANRLMKKGNALELAAAATRTNAQTRTFILSFMANVFDASITKTPALGRDAFGFLQLTIPSVIYPDKNKFFSEEGLVDQQFGFSYGDEANSVLTAGAADFGIVGVILYPLLMVLIARAVHDFLLQFLKPLPCMLVSLAFISLFLPTEATLATYFSFFRNTIIFIVLIQIYVSLPRLRLHPEYSDRIG